MPEPVEAVDGLAAASADAGDRLGNAYGAFSLGELKLALPMRALREVVPALQLQPLPAAATCAAGGLVVRGVLIPVLDLRVVLGRAAATQPAPLVIVIVQAGRVIGLLASEVGGVFEADDRGLHRAHDVDPQALLAGHVCRAGGRTLHGVLDTPALFAVPGMPSADDPEPARAGGLAVRAAGAPRVPMLPMMLVRCGGGALALPAVAVHSTLPDPLLERSPCEGGACVGVVAVGARRVPAVDLGAWCGLAPLPDGAARQALLIAFPAGLVALLIAEVLDLASIQAADVLPVPPLALARPCLFRGVLSAGAWRDGVAGAEVPDGRCLVLDDAAMRSDELLGALSQVNTGARAAQAGGAQAHAAAGQRAFVTYTLVGEVATPLEQVCEILAFDTTGRDAAGPNAVLDIVIERGRSVPVLCLARLQSLPPAAAGPHAVLVVESHGERVGFAVPQLRSIERADWEPAFPNFRGDGGRDRLALVGPAGAQRTLRVLDLVALARSLQGAFQAAA